MRDVLHMSNDGTYIFASNTVDFLNNFIFSKSIWLTEDVMIVVKDCRQRFDSSDEVKQNNSIDYLDYSNNVISHEKVIEKDSDFFKESQNKKCK